LSFLKQRSFTAKFRFTILQSTSKINYLFALNYLFLFEFLKAFRVSAPIQTFNSKKGSSFLVFPAPIALPFTRASTRFTRLMLGATSQLL